MLMFDVPRWIVLASVATGLVTILFHYALFYSQCRRIYLLVLAELLTQFEGFEMYDSNCCGDKETSFVNVPYPMDISYTIVLW